MLFFDFLKISTELVKTDPETWRLSNDYKTALEIVYHLKVVNNKAVREVALIEEYNSIVTKKENQNNLLQVANDHRRKFPECKKELFMVK